MNNLQHQLHKMKPMPGLAALLDKDKAKRIVGTKMRSFIKQTNAAGILSRQGLENRRRR